MNVNRSAEETPVNENRNGISIISPQASLPNEGISEESAYSNLMPSTSRETIRTPVPPLGDESSKALPVRNVILPLNEQCQPTETAMHKTPVPSVRHLSNSRIASSELANIFSLSRGQISLYNYLNDEMDRAPAVSLLS
jgi:hypothetical protein